MPKAPVRPTVSGALVAGAKAATRRRLMLGAVLGSADSAEPPAAILRRYPRTGSARARASALGSRVPQSLKDRTHRTSSRSRWRVGRPLRRGEPRRMGDRLSWGAVLSESRPVPPSPYAEPQPADGWGRFPHSGGPRSRRTRVLDIADLPRSNAGEAISPLGRAALSCSCPCPFSPTRECTRCGVLT